MIADSLIPQRAARRVGQRHRTRSPVFGERSAPWESSLWARFWDDRQAVGLKVALIIVGLLAVALLEAPR